MTFIENFKIAKTNEFNDELVEELQICISIRDEKHMNERQKLRIYQSALIKILRLHDVDDLDKVHDMYEMKVWSNSKSNNSRNLNHCRFYESASIKRSAHLISIITRSDQSDQKLWYVNNYIDWETYNTFYNVKYWKSDWRWMISIDDRIFTVCNHRLSNDSDLSRFLESDRGRFDESY